MPLFFIVSGLFVTLALSRKGIAEFILKRFSVVFYPLLIWGSLQITLQLIFSNYVHAQRQPIDYLNLLINPRKIEQFWYLNALFFVGVLYVIVKVKLRWNAWQQALFGLVMFWTAAAIQGKYEIGFLYDVLFFYLFFAVGDLLSGFLLHAKNYKFLSSWKSLALLTPIFLFLQHQFTLINLAQEDDYFVQYQMPALYVLAALIGGGFIVLGCFMLERYKAAKFLRVIGYHSISIYIMHLMITAFTRVLFTRFLHSENIPLIMITSLLLGIVVPMVVFNSTNRMGLWWLYTFREKDRIPVPKSEESLPEFAFRTPKESIRKKVVESKQSA
jgi:fucose 4-O-acetylase-like acetyltransferase